MVLAIGIVVDDAIVVVENVERVMEENPDLPPAEATLKAMRQITGPIIAISLVLLSVFVPVGFIPGLSGTLFRQFAVTISCAMLISAINALTLSPALCAVFLRHHGARRGAVGPAAARHRPRARRLCLGGAAPGARCRAVAAGGRGVAVPASISLSTHYADRLPAGGRPGRILHRRRNCRTAPRWRAPARWPRGWKQILQEHAADPGHAVDHRLLPAGRRRVRAERRVHGGAAEAVRRSRRRGELGAGAGRRARSARCSRSARRSSSRSTCRRSSAWAPAVVSNTSLRHCRARTRRTTAR